MKIVVVIAIVKTYFNFLLAISCHKHLTSNNSLNTILEGRYSYYLCFVEEEDEAQKSEVNCLKQPEIKPRIVVLNHCAKRK